MFNHPKTEAALITDTNQLGKVATYIYLQFPFPWFGHISRISLQKMSLNTQFKIFNSQQIKVSTSTQLEISTFFVHLIREKRYPKFQNLIRPHFKTTLPETMKQIVLSHHKVYILNVQLESLQLQEFIF